MTPRGSPPHGLQAAVARPFPELVPSGRRGPGSRARCGRRGRVCGGLWTRSRAGSQAGLRPGLTGSEGLGGRAVWYPSARALGLALGIGRGVQRRTSERRALFVGKVPSPTKVAAQRCPLRLAGPVLIIAPQMVLALLGVYSCFVGTS